MGSISRWDQDHLNRIRVSHTFLNFQHEFHNHPSEFSIWRFNLERGIVFTVNIETVCGQRHRDYECRHDAERTQSGTYHLSFRWP